MALPRLIGDLALAAAPVWQDEGRVWPVISACRQGNEIPRFLLTWAAATHWPRFLNPAQACCAGIPVNVCSLPEIALFFFKILSIFCWSAGVALLLLLFMFPWLVEPMFPWLPAPVPPPTLPGRPCCANTGAEYNRTASARIEVHASLMRLTS